MKVVQFFKNLVHKKRFWIAVSVVVICALGVWACKAGLRIQITFESEMEINWDIVWNAVSAISAVISALAAVAIPIVAVLFQHRLDSNKNDIRGSNLELLEKMGRIEKELEQYRDTKNINSTPVQTKNIDNKELKKQILEYIGIAMEATTRDIADYVHIPINQAKNLLYELRKLGLITTVYIRENTDSETCHWKRR